MSHQSYRITTLKALLLYIVLLVCFFLTACQPTPDKPVIVNKNKDLVEEVQSQPSPSTADESHKLRNIVLPDGHYTYSSQNEVASLTINVDADIVKPQADKMPFARVKPMAFTQQMVTGMVSYLFPDEKPYQLRTQRTKGEIEQAILGWKKSISSGTLDGVPLDKDDIAYYNEVITSLEKEYQTAPEEMPDIIVSDGTLQREETVETSGSINADGEWVDTPITKKSYELHVGLHGAYFDLRYFEGEENPEAFFSYTKAKSTFTTDGMVPINGDSEKPNAVQEILKISYKDAVEKANGFFAAAGMDDVMLFSSYLVDNHRTQQGTSISPSQYAYRLYYTRCVNGVPVSCDMSKDASGDDFYYEPWYYESIELTISDDGILNIDWESPCSTTEILNEDTDLIDFDTAIDKFQSAVGYTFGNYVDSIGIRTSIDVHIDSIQLSLVRLREKDTADSFSGLYVPAYVFYGYVKNKTVLRENGPVDEGYLTSPRGVWDIYPGPLMVIAINAVDGSIIDPLKDID